MKNGKHLLWYNDNYVMSQRMKEQGTNLPQIKAGNFTAEHGIENVLEILW